MKEKYRILLVLSGGTICTAVHEEEGLRTRKISGDPDVLLKKNFFESGSKYAGCVTIETSRNFGILSENMTIEKWNSLIKYFRDKENIKEYDGVIIAHGTDTLAYSSSMFSLVLKDLGIPVFLVSSNLPLSEEGANGNENFKGAVELICKNIVPNVYVIYRNTNDNVLYLHLGSRLKQCGNYDENFYSRGSAALPKDVGSLPEEELKAITERFGEPKATKYDKLISYKNICGLWGCVLKITPYVGLDYGAFDLSKFKAVLHGTYHSGTVCENTEEYKITGTSGSIWKLIDNAKGKCRIYVAPADLRGEIYDSVAQLLESGVRFVSGSTEEMTYCKLVLAYSLDCFHEDSIDEFINTDICGEICYK